MITWVVDELLGEDSYASGYPSIAVAAEELGHRVIRTKYKPMSIFPDIDNPPSGLLDPVVVYGTVQFCKQIEKVAGRQWCPGLYFNQNVKHFSRYAPHYAGSMLNDDYYILPLGEVWWRIEHTMEGPVFIKPESGLKEFTGQVVNDLYELDRMSLHHTLDAETLCVLASVKEIKAEFRYVIVNKEVITGSEYRWDNVLDVRRDTHPVCDHLANIVALNDWQPDTAYVVDVALMPDDTARIVELNALSSSGFYACDTHKIVKAVSAAAQREFDGDV